MIFEKTIINVYKNNIKIRQDGNPLLHYFSVSDFEGLQRTPFVFEGNNGQNLQGYYYYYPSARKDRLIIFDHGMGCGHVAYLKEIELIARRGYMVFTYDHTGCLESEGEDIGGFAQSLCDLDYAINALQSAKEYSDAKFTVIGQDQQTGGILVQAACWEQSLAFQLIWNQIHDCGLFPVFRGADNPFGLMQH